ncbi:peptide-N(4)-(N-acetyl-beta-glucosaminyl)asparagine amidase-like [Uloborus diversus]|uniref:peptide-N(4)-(N-acetyl-beta- glucosaminyl)asparagine amidase-like n=1 Tax=Uloborus diversus TaxID=327109 RepID=UPI0024095AE5|nr:peptide-N(4)-(N-acetyl-beta-glucosaminyl)asparagine amidase-like [Uloborus diversus]XP_054719562.1 peptide-N(4)-(N-acetyl-beta-glucosaminyl)asparagine amidase-like [Uloborus diversus]
MDLQNESEVKFFQELRSKSKLVQTYENLNLLQYAVDLIPVEELNIKASLKLSLIEVEENDVTLEDVLILELLSWFKNTFFKWVDIPKCESCGQLPEKRGIVPAIESEAVWGAIRVECYFCPRCERTIRFPRYNNPRKLLETRQGRCGEWANCFTLMCRALGYDARLVVDWNDHVWTEVYSFSKNRWMHCDSCENACDVPLLYEMGWKKPISYIIAFSKDEVQDVTWRYTSKFREVLNRRNLCRELWLLNCISSLTESLQSKASPERQRELKMRRVLELAEFLTPPLVNQGNWSGRTSGSLAWRIARGETELDIRPSTFVFNLNALEIEQKHFHIKYSCALNKYIRVSDKSSEIHNWVSCIFSYNDIFRKVENDWNIVYLARKEGSPKGVISWKFNFEDSGLVIQTLKLNLSSTTFGEGKVKWFLYPGSEQSIPRIYEMKDVTPLYTQEFKGSSGLVISAELTEGIGDVAWQHSQLFRQAADSSEFPFEVEIALDKP